MFPPDKTRDLFLRLDRMARERYTQPPPMNIAPLARCVERYVLWSPLYLTPLLLLSIGLLRYDTAHAEAIYPIAVYLTVAWITSGVFWIGLVIFTRGRILWRQRKNTTAGGPGVAIQDALRDAGHVRALCGYPKPLLNYALLECQQAWGLPEKRAMLLGGDLRKLGLLTALLAVVPSAQELLGYTSNPWLLVPPIITGAFSLMMFYALASGERREVASFVRTGHPAF